jgi:hypothetical protein
MLVILLAVERRCDLMVSVREWRSTSIACSPPNLEVSMAKAMQLIKGDIKNAHMGVT